MVKQVDNVTYGMFREFITGAQCTQLRRWEVGDGQHDVGGRQGGRGDDEAGWHAMQGGIQCIWAQKELLEEMSNVMLEERDNMMVK